jgi:hypothetical protein
MVMISRMASGTVLARQGERDMGSALSFDLFGGKHRRIFLGMQEIILEGSVRCGGEMGD